jgi:glycosyltransferase involved in cell wall biosynthesis
MAILYFRIRPSLAFHFTIKCNIYGAMACRLLRIRYVNNVSGLGSGFNARGFMKTLLGWLYRYTQNSAERVFVQNLPDLQFLTANGLVDEALAERIPGSGVDLDLFRPHVSENDDAFTFVFAGRVLWEKGFPYLPEAMRILRRRGVDAKCLVYGMLNPKDGKYVPSGELAKWEAEGLVRYEGSLEDVRLAYRKADCVVLPSFYREGVPRSLLEAAAMAKPIITTDWIGCREVVVDGSNGLLCQPKDAQGLADAMEKMARMPKAQRSEMGNAGRFRVESLFSEDLVIRKYLSFLDPVPG